jgi:hypothetical protein
MQLNNIRKVFLYLRYDKVTFYQNQPIKTYYYEHRKNHVLFRG